MVNQFSLNNLCPQPKRVRFFFSPHDMVKPSPAFGIRAVVSKFLLPLVD
jgi:hypothetical protein